MVTWKPLANDHTDTISNWPLSTIASPIRPKLLGLEGHMVKQDIVNRLVGPLGLSRMATTRAVDSVFDILKEALAFGERIELRGFGVFRTVNRKTGIGRNPKTGQVVPIPTGKTVKFKASKEMNLYWQTRGEKHEK